LRLPSASRTWSTTPFPLIFKGNNQMNTKACFIIIVIQVVWTKEIYARLLPTAHNYESFVIVRNLWLNFANDSWIIFCFL
jgi:hypothetical protein